MQGHRLRFLGGRGQQDRDEGLANEATVEVIIRELRPVVCLVRLACCSLACCSLVVVVVVVVLVIVAMVRGCGMRLEVGKGGTRRTAQSSLF